MQRDNHSIVLSLAVYVKHASEANPLIEGLTAIESFTFLCHGEDSSTMASEQKEAAGVQCRQRCEGTHTIGMMLV